MSNRKVKINFTLVGKSFDIKNIDNLDTSNILKNVKHMVKLHFGDRPILISDEDDVLRQSSYPRYFSAGWFISDEPIYGYESNFGSELIVVSHGDSMQLAQSEMMKAISSTNWDHVARNV